MKTRDVLKVLAADGWVERKSSGSGHRVFVHPTKPGHLSVAFHSGNADVPLGTLKKILKTAGLE